MEMDSNTSTSDYIYSTVLCELITWNIQCFELTTKRIASNHWSTFFDTGVGIELTIDNRIKLIIFTNQYVKNLG